jgi:thioredoxin-related protein
MKTINHRILLVLGIMISISFSTLAQAGKLPPFRMVQLDGKTFKAEDLPMGKPIIIIYFSPECDHCEMLVKNLMKKKNDLKKASIAMITYLPVDKVSSFVQQYKLNKEPNLYVGTEGNTMFLKNYYQLQQMPFIALYSKNGDLIKTYTTEAAIQDIAKRLIALQ